MLSNNLQQIPSQRTSYCFHYVPDTTPNIFSRFLWWPPTATSQGFLTASPRRFSSIAGLRYQRGNSYANKPQTMHTKRKYRARSSWKENVSQKSETLLFIPPGQDGAKGHGSRRPRLMERFAAKWELQLMTWPVSPVNPSLWPRPFSSYFSSGPFELAAGAENASFFPSNFVVFVSW